ncbi:ABC transporter family substrate-binding protein [uncultured Agrococcus sp.]|uniref:ABC transporter family substrate-binding protein n=1 Tax=uncultured Agrococcus sp. TaxID=382258 RepID=UPI0025FC3E96|nr:ABC transporter family substrate-binding protein [uncultured Agrococcus sp.]
MSTRFKSSRKFSATIAASAAAALVLAGCTTNGGGDGDDNGDDTTSGTVTIATTNAANSLNGATSDHNLNTNGMIDYITGNGWGSSGPGTFLNTRANADAEIESNRDETNGSFELVSEDPLTVEYTLNENAVWSDGTEMSVDDMLLTWVINSGWFAGEDADGEPASYFSLAGSTAGLDTTDFPEIDREARSLTITYDEPYVDWELVNMLGKPAHVFADQVDMTAEELTDFFTDAEPGYNEDETLEAIGSFFNNGYAITEMPSDEGLLVAAGPYVVSDFQANDGGYIEFSANPNWQGDAPGVDTLIISFIGDASTQIQQLANGEVDIIEPQADANTVQTLESNGAEIITGDQLSYDHVDLSFRGVFEDERIRQAFLHTIPRQAILDSIVTPTNPEAQILNSQMYVPSNGDDYVAATSENGYEMFDEPDIEAAQELLNGETPEVRILYAADNPNRVNAFRLIQQSAEEAGFVIVDEGDPEWSPRLGSEDYDAAIFGWISPGVGFASLPQIWQTGGGGNYNNYSNSDIDALVDESQTLIEDPERMLEIMTEIDTITREDGYGVPLFQSPGLVAHNGTVDGILYNPNQTGVIHNILEWSL